MESKKERIFKRIKNRNLKIFNLIQEGNSTVEENNKIHNTIKIDKDTFFSLYKKAKNQEIDIDTLEPEIARQILSMAMEELKINSRKIDEKLKTLEIGLDNAKRYDKEIELLKKAN